MRNIQEYSELYLKDDFEKVIVEYRRKKVLEILEKYKPKRILEIGCGVQSIFDFYYNYDNITVVEPSEKFCKIVQNSKYYNKKILLINDFIENMAETLSKEHFDFILVSSLIHELIKPDELMKVVYSLCSEKTIVHINVPNEEYFHLIWALESNFINKFGKLSETAIQYQRYRAFNTEKLEKYVENQAA